MESKAVWDSGFHAVDSGFQILDSRFFVSGSCRMDSRDCNHQWIPDSSSCIPFSKTQDFQFHRQQFRNPDFLTWGDINLFSVFFFRLLNILFVFCIIHWVHFQQRGEVWCHVTMVALLLDDNKTDDDGDGKENGKNNMFILNNIAT